MQEIVELQQRLSIAWCGQCGNISVDGINFERVTKDALQCLACGAVSQHFEYIRRSALPVDTVERILEDARSK